VHQAAALILAGCIPGAAPLYMDMNPSTIADRSGGAAMLAESELHSPESKHARRMVAASDRASPT
jgi:hypothetical protein